MIRTPTKQQNVSLAVYPNASICKLCYAEDTMLECEQCKGLYHFQCVNSSVEKWICQSCIKATKGSSTRSSTSSRRRSVLQLERLAKEKAIQDKLIAEKTKLAEKQAEIDGKFLQKEYEIRDNMTDSEDDDIASNVITKRSELVNDWPPKDVQFAYPLMSGTSNQPTDNGNPTADSQTGLPIDPNLFSIECMIHQQPIVQPTDTMLNAMPSVSNSQTAYSQANQNAPIYAGQTNSVPWSTAINYVNQQPLIPAPRTVPILAQPSTAGTNPSRQPIKFTPTVQQLGSTSNPPQPISTHQQLIVSSMANQQSNVLISAQRSDVPISAQQTEVQISTQPFVSVSTQQPFVSGPYSNPLQPTSTHQQPVVSSMASHQQYVPNSAQPPIFGPTLVPQLSVTTNQQQLVPNSAQQPTFRANMIHQSNFCPNPNVGPPRTSFNTPGFGQQHPPVNPWVTYDPELNPQQLAPTRLQLAARQSMPKDYPKFNGDPEKWSIFYNAYANCTTSCGLSNGENLSRLERCLEEPARKAVQNLLTRPEAVPDIIGTLKMLYGRPEASIDSQLKVIQNEAPPKMHKMETFIDFAMSVRNVTSEIQKTGMWQYLWNPQLMQQLVDKLPYQMRLEWGQIKLSTPNVNLSILSDWLFSRAQTACAVTLPCSYHINTHSKSNDSAKKNSNDPKNHTNSDKRACLACNGKSHDIYECRKFLGMSLNEKWETVKNNKICRICLGNHHVLSCESNSLCGESGCTIKHHRLLHNPTKTISTITMNNENQKPNRENVHSAHQMSKIVILRRYIPLTLFGPNGSINVLAFLDDGSDLTLIENWVAQRLGLTGIITDLFLEWTAKIVRKEPNSKSVTLKICGTQTQDKQYEIEGVRTVKSLNLPPQTVNVDEFKNAYKFLRRISIESYNDETPKILIGLKHCKISTPHKIRSGEWDEPMAAKTLLGWEIHGSNASSAQTTKINFHMYGELNSDDNIHRIIVPSRENLNRLRQGALGVTGDIRKIFQTAIREQGQESQRFLWREPGTAKIDVHILQIMSFGATCSLTSNQYVKIRNSLEFIVKYPRAEKEVHTNTYVDDQLQAFDTEAEAENITNKVNEVYARGGFEIRETFTRCTKCFDDVKPIEVGDQVIIVDENSPRNMWDRGVVIEAVQTEADGRIRRASVRTTEGIYTRPVSKLAVLDIAKPEAKTLTRETLAGGTVTASNDI